ncbi:hypothetical protein POM88_002501 [Heracleum sosnowskyi]|uniref:F-box domain-containing protein n=1 Tax=Heracleum sosnowskyi TaxID=360622 RepID=A0AAD8JHS5_9APIA|nr:hypothetical protein POM88_002501 [Heracleum sosnowskyi]
MLKISSLFSALGKTKLLVLFPKTFQVLSSVPNFFRYKPSPFVNQNELYLVGNATQQPRWPIQMVIQIVHNRRRSTAVLMPFFQAWTRLQDYVTSTKLHLRFNFGSNGGRNEEEDRISALPDELIHRILSFGVDLNVVVQTSVLSKRWVNLWSTFQFLNFKARPLGHGNDGMYHNDAIYCNFITKFLLNRNRHSGACFVDIDFAPFDQCVKGMILSILSQAVSHSVQELRISNSKNDSYLSFPALRTLSLDHCKVTLTKWSLPCLTTLHLINVFPYREDFSFKELLCLKNLCIGECTGAYFAADPEGGFPCLKVVVFNIDVGMYTYEDYNLEDDNQVNEIILNISSLFREFGETKVLILYRGTIQIMCHQDHQYQYTTTQPALQIMSLTTFSVIHLVRRSSRRLHKVCGAELQQLVAVVEYNVATELSLLCVSAI